MQTATQRGLEPVKFLIDKTASRFIVQTFATGLLSSFGHNPIIGIRDFRGERSNSSQQLMKKRIFV